MKRLLSLLVATVAAATIYAATPIDNVIAEANKEVPTQIQPGMTFNGVQITDTAVVFSFILSDELFAQMAPFIEMMHDSVLAEVLSDQDPTSKSIIQYCRENNKNLIQRFTNSKNENLDVVVKASELK